MGYGHQEYPGGQGVLLAMPRRAGLTDAPETFR